MKVEQQKFQVFEPLTYEESLRSVKAQLESRDVLERSKKAVQTSRDRDLMWQERGFNTLARLDRVEEFRPQDTPALSIPAAGEGPLRCC